MRFVASRCRMSKRFSQEAGSGADPEIPTPRREKTFAGYSLQGGHPFLAGRPLCPSACGTGAFDDSAPKSLGYSTAVNPTPGINTCSPLNISLALHLPNDGLAWSSRCGDTASVVVTS